MRATVWRWKILLTEIKPHFKKSTFNFDCRRALRLQKSNNGAAIKTGSHHAKSWNLRRTWDEHMASAHGLSNRKTKNRSKTSSSDVRHRNQSKNESMIDAATAISESNSAYVFAFLENAHGSGAKAHSKRKKAETLAPMTLHGSTVWRIAPESSFQELKQKVQTKRRHHRSGV